MTTVLYYSTMTTDYQAHLTDGIDVAIRSYEALTKEKNPEIYKDKMKFLGQCLNIMKERINERSDNPPK